MDKTSILGGLWIQSLNDMIDSDTVRVSASRNLIPDSIWFMLAVVTILSMTVMGYEHGIAGTRSWIASILLVVTFATVLVLIADLDSAQSGFLQVSKQPLLDLISKIGTPFL